MERRRRRQFAEWVQRTYTDELHRLVLVMWADGKSVRSVLALIQKHLERRDGHCTTDKARVEFRRIVSCVADRLHEFELETDGVAASVRERWD